MIVFSEENENLFRNLKKFSTETYYHSIRVKDLVLKMLIFMNEEKSTAFSQEMIDTVCKGALLHDIGKLFVKNSILTKKVRLDSDEKKNIDLHTHLGYEAIRNNNENDSEEIIPKICLYHHERIDGSGIYHITEIPKYVQIVSICDAFDALRSDRIYRSAIPKNTALDMIENGMCGAFSPTLVKYLRELAQTLTDAPPTSYTNHVNKGENR